jgi:hypothetical protein
MSTQERQALIDDLNQEIKRRAQQYREQLLARLVNAVEPDWFMSVFNCKK